MAVDPAGGLLVGAGELEAVEIVVVAADQLDAHGQPRGRIRSSKRSNRPHTTRYQAVRSTDASTRS
jgi:hypothetical protein